MSVCVCVCVKEGFLGRRHVGWVLKEVVGSGGHVGKSVWGRAGGWWFRSIAFQ